MSEMNTFVLARNGHATRSSGLSIAPIFFLPDDVLIAIMDWLPVPDLIRQTHVCRLWRNTLLLCPSLWGHLDLAYAADCAGSIFRALVPRSGAIPLDVFLRLSDPIAIGDSDPWTSLAPHVHRLRHFSLHAESMDQYEALFHLLCGPLPHLVSLDISPLDHQTGPRTFPRRDGLFSNAPRLSRVIWGLQSLPCPLNDLGKVTHLDIRGAPVRSLERIFSMFPRARVMSLRTGKVSDIEPLPARHPLQRLELEGYRGGASSRTTLWAEVTGLGFTRLPMLVLRSCAMAVLYAACASDWQAESISIDPDDVVSATLVCGARQCQLHGLVGALSDKPVAQLLGDYTCLASLRSLTTSVVRQRFNTRPGGFFPLIELPELTTLTLVCGSPRNGGGPWDLLLDDPLYRGAGVLRAPQLRTIVVRSGAEGGDCILIAPSAVSWLLRAHIELRNGRRLPELRLDGPRVQFSEPLGDALTALVENVEHTL